MRIIKTTKDLQEFIQTKVGSIGFVPTMGALHEGHVYLINQARVENEIVIVSIFVNPTQFLPNEDLAKYPRRQEADIKICELANVNILFMPDASEMYFRDEPMVISPQIKGYILEGFERPSHYDGVLSVVLKLLLLTNASNAYFGQKDAQQLILITQMVKRFFVPTNIVPCPTVRDEDGLALSSRNAYLSDEQKIQALKISKSLFVGASLIAKNELNSSVIISKMQNELAPLDIDYIAITDRELNFIDSIIIGNSLILVAARVGGVRLIDNLWV